MDKPDEDPLEAQALRFALQDSIKTHEEEKRLSDLRDIQMLEKAIEMSMVRFSC